jgi:Ser/Thr protein kinase RdoA (MazF antagonist)
LEERVEQNASGSLNDVSINSFIMEIPVEQNVKEFEIRGRLQDLHPIKRGHINDTYMSVWRDAGHVSRFIHQRINQNVFRDVPAMMRNIELITAHLKRKLQEEGVKDETTLTIVPTWNGQTFLVDNSGNYWRTYEYVEDTINYETCQNESQAFETAHMMGKFLQRLMDLPVDKIADTIPNFHNIPKRFSALENSIQKDVSRRVTLAQAEINFALQRKNQSGLLIDALKAGLIPPRITHNDAKLNNILFNTFSNKAVCLVDLDTCMQGSSLYDFGDLARNTSVLCREDEQDFSRVSVDLNLFKAIVSGFLRGIGPNLNELERELMPVSPRLFALTLGVRFLTDYLDGDTYFKIDHPNHNLERARTQFKIVERFEDAEPRLREIVDAELDAL